MVSIHFIYLFMCYVYILPFVWALRDGNLASSIFLSSYATIHMTNPISDVTTPTERFLKCLASLFPRK